MKKRRREAKPSRIPTWFLRLFWLNWKHILVGILVGTLASFFASTNLRALVIGVVAGTVAAYIARFIGLRWSLSHFEYDEGWANTLRTNRSKSDYQAKEQNEHRKSHKAYVDRRLETGYYTPEEHALDMQEWDKQHGY